MAQSTWKKLAMITGASAGIGEATALRLSKVGCGLVLLGRREGRLDEVAGRCRAAGASRVLTAAVDVSVRSEVEMFFTENSAPLKDLTVVVNNAGLALGTDPMPTANLDDWDTMVDTNIKGLLAVTRFALPFIRANSGHIINIGSVAGHWAYPGGGVYCATKAAVKILTEGLRLDLQGSGVRVTNIEPGMVETEFSKVRFGDDERAKKVYAGMTPLTADDIAESIEWCLGRPAHVNVQELMLFPTDQAAVGVVNRK